MDRDNLTRRPDDPTTRYEAPENERSETPGEVDLVGGTRNETKKAALEGLPAATNSSKSPLDQSEEICRIKFSDHDREMEFQKNNSVPKGTSYLGIHMETDFYSEGNGWYETLIPLCTEDSEYLLSLGGFGYLDSDVGVIQENDDRSASATYEVVPILDANVRFSHINHSATEAYDNAIFPDTSYPEFVKRCREEAAEVFRNLRTLVDNEGFNEAFFAATGNTYKTIDALEEGWKSAERKTPSGLHVIIGKKPDGLDREEEKQYRKYVEGMKEIQNDPVINCLPEIVRIQKENDDLRGVLANTQRRLQQIQDYERIGSLIGCASRLEDLPKGLIGKSFRVQQQEGGEGAFFAHLAEEFSPDKPINGKTLPKRIQEVERGVEEVLKVLLEQQMQNVKRGKLGARYELEELRSGEGGGNWEGVLACTRKHILNKGNRGNVSVDLGEAVSHFLNIEGGKELVEKAMAKVRGISVKDKETKEGGFYPGEE